MVTFYKQVRCDRDPFLHFWISARKQQAAAKDSEEDSSEQVQTDATGAIVQQGKHQHDKTEQPRPKLHAGSIRSLEQANACMDTLGAAHSGQNRLGLGFLPDIMMSCRRSASASSTTRSSKMLLQRIFLLLRRFRIQGRSPPARPERTPDSRQTSPRP